MILNIGLHGRIIRCEAVHKVNGRRRLLSGEQPNLLLTAGMNAMGLVDNWMDFCQVGNGSSEPAIGQTGLDSHVAGTSTHQNDLDGAQGTEPWYGWRRVTYRFAEGVAAGNLSEVGIGWATSGATLISRQLIRNGAGDPITIEVLSTEYLDITYEMRFFPPLIDVPGTTTILGVLYNTITRASEVNSGAAWGQRIGRIMTEHSVTNADWQAYDGLIGTLEQAPSGAAAANDNSNAFATTYLGNSFVRTVGASAGSTGWVLGAGIRSMRIMTTGGNYQTQFGEDAGALGNTIPKTTDESLTMNWTFGWTAAVIP